MMATAPELARIRELCMSGEARTTRLAARVSLSEMGADAGVSTATIHRWETGQRLPRGEAAVRYGQLLRRLRRINEEAADAS